MPIADRREGELQEGKKRRFFLSEGTGGAKGGVGAQTKYMRDLNLSATATHS